ncbi:MAG TPA: hypothetical protein VJ909_09485 [Prolixibacteraceae bacterium]|nr:hypothetical protein [Prolixibacteraceae bacterium]
MIRNKLLYFAILFLLGLLSCGPDDEFLSGDISVYEIEDKTNYLLPLVLENTKGNDITLNGTSINFENGIFELKEAGFYKMIIDKSDTLCFTLIDDERGEAEWGLKKWATSLPDFDTHFDGEMQIVHPVYGCEGIEIPFVIRAGSWNIQSDVSLQGQSENGALFNLKYGTGISSSEVTEANKLELHIAGNDYLGELQNYKNETLKLPEYIENTYEIPANTQVMVEHDTEIADNASLVINSGCTVLASAGVNITVNGNIQIKGSHEAPVLVTCNDSEKLFGGFIVEGSGSHIGIENCFFTRFGFHSGDGYQYGHANHQALFKMKNAEASFFNCYFYDSPGQVFYPESSQLKLENCVVSSVKTTGEVLGGKIDIAHSYFSDFPDDSPDYQNADNDALYINMADARISNSMFMYTKDDGIDSGAGGGGTIVIDSCRFEACFHEGLALSSIEPSIKTHTISNSYFKGCQQGVELGYSSSNHSVLIMKCYFEHNHIGIRYGDNYKNDVNGTMTVREAVFSNNDKDYWNMVRKYWTAIPGNFNINE